MPLRIRVVDDDEALVFMLKENLEAEGYAVEIGYDGQAAVAAKTPADLLIMDFNMPGMNGLKALDSLRNAAATAHMPVILLTGESSERILPGGGDAKTRCFSKPVELDELNKTVRQMLAR